MGIILTDGTSAAKVTFILFYFRSESSATLILLHQLHSRFIFMQLIKLMVDFIYPSSRQWPEDRGTV